jgi:hypothetical protein
MCLGLKPRRFIAPVYLICARKASPRCRAMGLNHPTTWGWDLETGEVLGAFTADASLLSCAVGPVEGVIAAGDKSGQVHFLSLELNEDQ